MDAASGRGGGLGQQAAAASLEAQRAEARRHRKRVQGLVASKAPVWQQIDALIDGLRVHNDDPEWLIQLADAQFSMNRFAEAGENYAAAALLKPNQADLHFREGWCWELSGSPGRLGGPTNGRLPPTLNFGPRTSA